MKAIETTVYNEKKGTFSAEICFRTTLEELSYVIHQLQEIQETQYNMTKYCHEGTGEYKGRENIIEILSLHIKWLEQDREMYAKAYTKYVERKQGENK